MYLARNIRYLRKLHSMSQEDLADKLGYSSYTTVQKWETGASDPPIEIVVNLAELFHVSVDNIISKDFGQGERVQAIGSRIERVRSELGYSLDEIADRVGVAASTIQRYEKGLISSPKIPVLESIAKCLGVNLCWLTDGIGEKYTAPVLISSCIEAEKAIIEAYRNSNEHIQYAVRKLLDCNG